MRRLPSAELPRLLEALARRGYQVVGPAVREGAIVLEELRGELPRGYRDHQAPGRYRLEATSSGRYFDYASGPMAYKRFLHPPEASLFRTRRQGDRLVFEPAPAPERKLALIGPRACDLEAIAILDRVLAEEDPSYCQRRQGMFVLAVQCARAGELCACSTPRAASGFDLALTELAEGFLVEVGTPRGQEVLDEAGHHPATPEDLAEAGRVWRATAGQVREFPKVRRLAPDHPRWQQVAERCLMCGNCTMVCPTCFCTTPVDGAEGRSRVWDSCFTLDYSFVHGGPLRSSPASRYRQWLTHKLSTWHDQFGTPGCVGCGRCIAWCPVAIDIYEEASAIDEPSQ